MPTTISKVSNSSHLKSLLISLHIEFLPNPSFRLLDHINHHLGPLLASELQRHVILRSLLLALHNFDLVLGCCLN